MNCLTTFEAKEGQPLERALKDAFHFFERLRAIR
jgi:hypothetical protein